MLKTLEIQNVALIDNISLDFSNNLNVLSGETGAGKSIIVDSLNFVIGGKSNKSLIKQGMDYMKVVACFTPPFCDEIVQTLKDFDVEYEDEIFVSRKLTLDGKSDFKVNGKIFPIANFKKLCIWLIDIHSQHEHQKLFKEKFHLEILDDFLKNHSLFEEFWKYYEELKNVNLQISKLNNSTENQERMLDLLDYQISEIENANILQNEDEELEQKKNIMQNSEKIYENLNLAIDNFEGSSSMVDCIKKASSYLSSIEKYDDTLNELIQRLDNLKFEAIDIVGVLRDKKEDCNFNQYEFEEIDTRLDKIKNIKKKYGPTLKDVFNFLEKSKEQYNNIINSKDLLKTKLKEKETILNSLYKIVIKISDERKKISNIFEDKINKELIDLGMKNARFKVVFNDFPNFESFEKELTINGCDKVAFYFSANLGQSLKPLSEIISGGEASRFMLALKNIIARNDNINLMVFDEIDTDISGEMGYKVACKLANISRNHQVISISHLPQICAMADRNILVKKEFNNNTTFVNVKTLNYDETLREIARLSGGDVNSQNSILHAKDLKEKCNLYKSSIKDNL